MGKIFPAEEIIKIIRKERKENETNKSDSLYIAYDKEYGLSTLGVFRQTETTDYVNLLENEEADRVYNLLTGGM